MKRLLTLLMMTLILTLLSCPALAAPDRETVAEHYPDYTLHRYCTNDGYDTAEAVFYRIDGGMLHVIHGSFADVDARTDVTEYMPVPLSPVLLARLETERVDSLLSLAAGGDLFLTEDAYDTAKIPIGGRLINSMLHADALVLLLEEPDGARRLHIVEENDDGYNVICTPALPVGTRLETIHAVNGSILFQWQQGEQYRCAMYARQADGIWLLQYCMSQDYLFSYDYAFCGVQVDWNAFSTNGMHIGSLPGSVLPDVNLTALPDTEAGIPEALDRSGWAVVDVCDAHYDPRFSRKAYLHLRAQPDVNAESLGMFFNGTPVRVLERRGDWVRVSIGLDGRLTGWMAENWLATGERMDSVQSDFLPQLPHEKYENAPIYSTPALDSTHETTRRYWVVGMTDSGCYILLTAAGETGYAPRAWFDDGHG